MGSSSVRGPTRSGAIEMDELGIVVHIHSRGFGFACCLSGDRSREVFLNESRISRLQSTNSQPLGRLIRMRVVRQSDDRLSASRVSPLDPTDVSTIELARHYLALREGSSHACAGPAPILRLLVGINPAIDRILRPMFDAVTEAEWLSPALLETLKFAPPQKCYRAISHHLRAGTPRAPETAYQLISDNKIECPVAWLQLLWDSLPEARNHLQRLALGTKARMSLQEIAHWSKLALDHNERAASDWWDALANALESGLQLDSQWLEWPQWKHAPWKVATLALQKLDPSTAKYIEQLNNIAANSHKIGRTHASTVLENIGPDDQRLADMWVPRTANDAANGVIEALTAQMRTARVAELWAATYMKDLGFSVEDIALTQLDGRSTEWLVMDLRIDGKYGLDVKNLRRNLNGGIQSSRWKVKQFKSDAAGSDVVLCGVSSPYTWLNNGTLNCTNGEYVRILGITTATEIQKLLRRFKSIFELRSQKAPRLTELPAWAWDYPKAQYKERDRLITGLRAAIPSLANSPIGRRCMAAMPPIFFASWGLEPPMSNDLTPQQRDFLDLFKSFQLEGIQSKQQASIPRLPWLYLFTLHSWARWRAASESTDSSSILDLFQWHAHSPSDAKNATYQQQVSSETELDFSDSAVFQTGRSFARPSSISGTGVADPANVMATLLNGLSILEKNVSRTQFIALSDITIHYNGVLVGTFPDGQRRTLLAHCGGRLEEKNVECGHRPLVYGKQKTCTCGRLICEKCGSCADPRYEKCAQQEDRRNQMRLKKKLLRR